MRSGLLSQAALGAYGRRGGIPVEPENPPDPLTAPVSIGFPELDYGPPVQGVLDQKPRPFQVLDEGEEEWLGSYAEFNFEYYRTCGPIAVAHAVNFSRAALGLPGGTLNVADAIDLCVEVGAYTRGDQTTQTGRLADAVEAATGLRTVTGWDTLTFWDALALAQTRWIICNTPGHISLVVADRRGRPFLHLVQYRVSSGGRFDAGDLIITEPEWPAWTRFTCWPDRELWHRP